ncbi:MAG: hypothetical protein IJN44_10515 [Clostridia bacterium]|nr:hypothetical protein [Clostridia bacterium]
MTMEQFLDGVRQNMARVKEYQLGMDGRNGQCDCIGLLIGGIRLAGGVWNGTHGSNYAARNEMRSLEKITSAAQLQLGDWVYKTYSPDQPGYGLPDTYSHDPDQNDYYHVGVVTSVQPLVISQCTTVPGGIKEESTADAWQYVGKYSGIGEENLLLEPYRVTGGRLKLRKGPGTNYAVVSYIPDGALVMAGVGAEQAEWLSVSYAGANGYAIARYLMKENETQQDTKQLLERLQTFLLEAQQITVRLLSAG